MRLVIITLLLLVSVATASVPPAVALSCVSSEDSERYFRIHDIQENRTVAEALLAHWAYGSVCGFGNAHALGGDWFAWLEPPANATDASVEGAPWRLEVLHLPTGHRYGFDLSAGKGHRLSVEDGKVLLAYRPTADTSDGDSAFLFRVIFVEAGLIADISGDLPPDARFALDGMRIHWLVTEALDGPTLRTRNATTTEPAATSHVAIPDEGFSYRLAAANARWLIIPYAQTAPSESAEGLWAYDRATGSLHEVPGVEHPSSHNDGVVFYVEHELDGDDLYLQDASGLRWLGRGDHHRVRLPDGVPERLGPAETGGVPADSFHVDEGRIVLRDTRPPATPTASENGTPEEGPIVFSDPGPRVELPHPGLALAVLAVAGASVAWRRRHE